MAGWSENWVNVVRQVLFRDDALKQLMAIPLDKQNDLIAFRDRYFIKGAPTDAIITNEKVRILYHEDEPGETDSSNVMRQRLYIDIYVREDSAYNAAPDRMLHRGALIAKRLNFLLGGRTHFGISFRGRGVYDQSSRAEGYDRMTAVFMYKRIYK